MSNSAENNVPEPILVRLEAIEAVRAISREHTDCQLACLKGSPAEVELLKQHIAVLDSLLKTAQSTLNEV